MRVPYFLLVLFAAAVVADVKTHISQPIEMGVTQNREDTQTDVVTFNAFVRTESSTDPNIRFILSFLNFTCDGTCGESTSNLCETNPSLNDGWNSHHLDSYPHVGDPPAEHIWRSIEVDSEFDCEDGLTWGYDDSTGTAWLSGNLYLHTVHGCDQDGCPVYISSDIYPFYLTYNTESGALTGLGEGRDVTYVYDIHYKRNLWLTGMNTLLEFQTNVQTLADSNIVSVPLRFQNPVISKQETVPEMKIVGLTECGDDLAEESICSQDWYFQAIDSTFQPGPVFGPLEVVADLVFSDGSIVRSLIHIEFNVASLDDPGQTHRLIDSIATVQLDDGEIVPFFTGSLTPTQIMHGNRFCITVSSPDLSGLVPGAVRVCASQSVDLIAEVSPVAGCHTPNVADMVMYEIINLQTGYTNSSFEPTIEQDPNVAHQFKVCFKAIPISEKAEVIEAYYVKVISDNPVPEPHHDGEPETTVPSTTEEEPSQKKRQIPEETYIVQSCPVGCAWSEVWSPALNCCVPYGTSWDNNDWDWLWILFLIFFFIVLIGLSVLVCCYVPDYSTGPQYYPYYYTDCGHLHIVNKKPDGSIVHSVQVTGDNNDVRVDSPDVRKAMERSRNPTARQRAMNKLRKD